MSVKEYIEQRFELVKQARNLLNSKGGNLTPGENKEYDSMLDEIEKLSEKIDNETKLLSIEQELSKPVNSDKLEMIRGASLPSYENKNLQLRGLKDIVEERKRIAGGKRLSVGNVIKAISTGDWSKVTREERDAIGTGDQGQWLISQEMGKILIMDALAHTQVMNAGARVVEVTQNELLIPKLTAYPEAKFKAENQVWPGDETIGFNGLVLTPRTLASYVTLSIELAEDGYRVEDYISQAMAKVISQAMDQACLRGSGTLNDEPTGIVNWDGVLTEDVNNLDLTSYDHFSNAYFQIESNNVTPTGLIIPSEALHQLDLLKDKNDNPLQPPESWKKLKIFSSNQLVNNAVMGDFTNLIIGTKNKTNLEVSREAGDSWEKMQIKLRIYTRFDCGVALPYAFCNIKNIGAVSS